MGTEESGGLGEKTRKGKGDCSRAAPLSLGCLPKIPVDGSCVTHPVKQIEQHKFSQDIGRTLLRGWRTQSIKDKPQPNGHFNKLLLRIPGTKETRPAAPKPLAIRRVL